MGPVVNVWLTALHGIGPWRAYRERDEPVGSTMQAAAMNRRDPLSPFGMPKVMPGSVAWVGDRRHPTTPGRGSQRRPHG
jgi:hypothetical protein